MKGEQRQMVFEKRIWIILKLDGDVDWNVLAQGREKWQAVLCMVMKGEQGKPYSVLVEKY